MLAGEMGNDTMSYNGWGLFTELLLTGRWPRLFAETHGLRAIDGNDTSANKWLDP